MRHAAERDRFRLLDRLGETQLVTPEAQRLFAELRAANVVPQRAPRGPRVEMSWGLVEESPRTEIEGVSSATRT